MRAATTIAAAALALAPTVAATGQAIVKNKCNFPVYLWSVSNTDGNMHTLDANSGEYSETYRENPTGGGISIKMSREQNYYQSSIAQLEYTLGNTLWYDLSNINGNPFMEWGYSLLPSESGCRKVACAAGQANCDAVYNVPSDNHATAACSNDANAVLELCSDSNTASSVSSGGIGAITPLASIVNNVVNAIPAAASPTVNVAAVQPAAAASTTAPDTDTNNDDPNVIVFTTFVTQLATPAVAAPATAAATDEPEWFGHHLASEGWDFHSAKVGRRHEHHPAHVHAAEQLA